MAFDTIASHLQVNWLARSLLLVALCSGCGRSDEGFLNSGGHLPDGTHYKVLWRKDAVEFIVFCRSEILVEAGPMLWLSSQWRGSTPTRDGISLLPEGLFVDGVRVDTSGPNKVFVVQTDRTLRPIRVVQADLTSLSKSEIDGLEGSDFLSYLREQMAMP